MKQKKARTILQKNSTNIQWKTYYRLARFTEELDRPKDAAALKKIQHNPIPLAMLPMIF